MNTELLKTFLTIVQTGSFTKAAQQLYVVQSTVSNRMKELEKEIGQPLLVRSGLLAELTPYGKAFLPYAKKILELESLAYAAIVSKDQFVEHLNIGTVFYQYETLISRKLSGFCAAYPRYSIQIRPDVSATVNARVYNGSLDFAYTHHYLNHPRCYCQQIGEDDMLFVTNGHNTTFAKGINSEDIKKLPIVYSSYLDASTYEWLFSKHHVFPLDITVGNLVIPFIKSGDYYSFLPRKLIETELLSETLMAIPVMDKDLPPLKTYLLYDKSSLKKNEIKDWINYFHPCL